MQNQYEEGKVSIIIPCYNGARLLHNSLDSILMQTYRNLQVILIDDGSTDDTRKIADAYAIKFAEANMEFFYFYKENGGAASAINVGLKHYNGDYLMWLDSDDILIHDSIEKCVAFLTANPQYDYCMGEGVVVKEGSYDDFLQVIKRIERENETKEIMLYELIYGVNCVFGPGTVLCRKQLIDRAIPKSGIYESREGQNWQLLIPITYYGTRGYINEILFKCVTHDDSHSRRRRSTDDLMRREREFIKLCTTTINHISQMPEEEKAKWNAVVETAHLKNIHQLSLRYLRIKTAIHTAKELTQLGCTELRYKNIIVAYLSFIKEKLFTK